MKLKPHRPVLFYCLASFFLILLPLLALEFFVRDFILYRPFLYYEITPHTFPTYRLKNEFENQTIRIRERKKTHYPRNPASPSLLLLGDSVSFCTLEDARVCLSERVQHQGPWQVHNYGVVGYGLAEILEVASRVIPQSGARHVVYQWNVNDLYSAKPVLLSLLDTPSHRMESLDTYRFPLGGIVQWLKDHWKTPWVAKYFFSMAGVDPVFRNHWYWTMRHHLGWVDSTPVKKQKNSGYLIRPPLNEPPFGEWPQCALPWKGYRSTPSPFNWVALWNQMYQRLEVQQALVSKVVALRDLAQKEGATFSVLLFFDYPFFKQNNFLVPHLMVELFKRHEIEVIDSLAAFRNHWGACGLYADPHHPGKLGHALLAQELLTHLPP